MRTQYCVSANIIKSFNEGENKVIFFIILISLLYEPMLSSLLSRWLPLQTNLPYMYIYATGLIHGYIYCPDLPFRYHKFVMGPLSDDKNAKQSP